MEEREEAFGHNKEPETKKTKVWWSFILGLLGFAFGVPFTGIPAIILGHKQMKEYPCWQANVGRILGIITTILGIGLALLVIIWEIGNKEVL